MPVATETADTAVLKNMLRQGSDLIKQNDAAIDQKTSEIAKVVGAAGGNEAQELVEEISKAAEAIGQLEQTLADRIAERQQIEDRIALLEAQISALPADVIQSIKDEKLKQLEELKNQKARLDIQIDLINAAIDKKPKKSGRWSIGCWNWCGGAVKKIRFKKPLTIWISKSPNIRPIRSRSKKICVKIPTATT